MLLKLLFLTSITPYKAAYKLHKQSQYCNDTLSVTVNCCKRLVLSDLLRQTEEDGRAQCMLSAEEMGTVGTDKEESVS